MSTCLHRDIHDWRITFVDTGMTRNIGERLMAVKEHLQGEEMFLANYSDSLTDLNLPDMIDDFTRRDRAVASFLCVRPESEFSHRVAQRRRPGRRHRGSRKFRRANQRRFLCLRQEIFDYMQPGEELVD